MGHYVRVGLLGGFVGGVLMSMVEMTTELVMGHSFFTPTYMIAAPFVGMRPMETAMKSPGFAYFDPGPVMIGMLGHFGWALLWGLVFGLIAWRLRLYGGAAAVGAIVYSYVIAFVMSYVVLPFVRLQPIPASSGWGAFVLMHAGYGIGLAIVAWLGTRIAGAAIAERGRVEKIA